MKDEFRAVSNAPWVILQFTQSDEKHDRKQMNQWSYKVSAPHHISNQFSD